jgi:hypothetical protein
MSDDGLFDEMSDPWQGRERQGPARPLTVDEDTASRLLDGSLTAADAPPGYSRVADLLAAATAPPTSAELAGEDEARAAFRAAQPARPAPTKQGARSKVLVFAATIASLVVLSGLAAAVNGTFDAASDPSDGNESPSATDERGRGASGRSASDEDPVDETGDGTGLQAGGPDATGPAAVGLCRAYGSGQGDKAHARAFRALAAAAASSPGTTDEERIASYCATVIAAAETPATISSAPPANPGGNGNAGGNSNAGGNGNGNAGGNGNSNAGGNGNGNGGGNGNSNAGGNGNGNGGGNG